MPPSMCDPVPTKRLPFTILTSTADVNAFEPHPAIHAGEIAGNIGAGTPA